MQLPYNPAIACLGIYPGETKTYVYPKTCPLMFKAALFVVAQTWKQSRCRLMVKQTISAG